MHARVLLGAVLISLCLATSAGAETKTAIFAGGCFWCVESDFDRVPGVLSTTSGYIGGKSEQPTYKTYGEGGHREAVRIDYDARKVSYAALLDIFWHSVDPTDGGGQFCDRGHGYTTAIYAMDPADLDAAQRSRQAVEAALDKAVATEIALAPAFWPAEDYHQDFYRRNPLRYRFYRSACGRDERIREIWGNAAFQGIPSH